MSDCQTGFATAGGLYGVLPNAPKEYEGAKDFRAFDLITVVMMEGGPSMNEADKFAKKVMVDWGLGLYDLIPPEKYIPYASKHPCFIKWLLRQGCIKEKVKDEPFEITLTMENKDELTFLWHLLNNLTADHHQQTIDWAKGRHISKIRLWRQVDNIRKEVNK